ncbi:caspase domain-containing protein [Rhizoctonia solani AG-1 IA]|uniref:Caspase domain-containing protein n=1 Tax=Thanatephorus cucumeris (strain AG1-IA) TaxID=983506 RepID=L8WHP9_THACA|nr:caspase domain-containing protein [Rhizoctonia solani AG-1 IA]
MYIWVPCSALAASCDHARSFCKGWRIWSVYIDGRCDIWNRRALETIIVSNTQGTNDGDGQLYIKDVTCSSSLHELQSSCQDEGPTQPEEYGYAQFQHMFPLDDESGNEYDLPTPPDDIHQPDEERQHYGPVVYNEDGEEVQPLYFRLSQATGKRKALLIGCNYPGSSAPLNGCINDVFNIKRFLIGMDNLLYDEADICVLADDESTHGEIGEAQPTREAMILVMEDDHDGDEWDGKDECPYFFSAELYDLLVKPLPEGAGLTALFDSCHSGSVLGESPLLIPMERKTGAFTLQTCHGQCVFGSRIHTIYSNIVSTRLAARSRRPKTSRRMPKLKLLVPKIIKNDTNGLLLMWYVTKFDACQDRNLIFIYRYPCLGTHITTENVECVTDLCSYSCRDNQFSSDARFGGLPSGALSYAFIRAFHKFPELTYNQLLKAIFNELKGKFDQRPQLSGSHPIDMDLLFVQ